MEDIMIRKFQFFSVICDVVQTFGEMELGNCKVDEVAVAEYVESIKFIADLWNCKTKEDIQQKITDDILNGFPVWQFLKVSDWTKNMLEKSYAIEQTKKWNEVCKKYKCYTCKYYSSQQTSLGLLEECMYKDKSKFVLKRRDFEVKEKCGNYKRSK